MLTIQKSLAVIFITSLTMPMPSQEAIGGKAPWAPENSSPHLTTALVTSMPSSERPFRLFLNPEVDFSPYGTYLPEWELIYPKGISKNAFFSAQVHYHKGQIFQHPNGHASAWVVVEDRTKTTKNDFTYFQSRIFFDPTAHKVYLDREAFYNSKGEFISFKIYNPRIIIEEAQFKDAPWGGIISILTTYIKEHPGNTYQNMGKPSE